MIEPKIESAIKDHVEVLSQYMTSQNTDHSTLAGMIVKILMKFFKKVYFEKALDIWFEKENLKPSVKIEDKIKSLKALLKRKFDAELVDNIIADVNKYYKIKALK
jgi:hypothetical protein